MLGNDADALDATQDALVSALRALGRFDGRSSFGTWIYRIATNVCIDELRRRRRRPVTGYAMDIADAAAADEFSHRQPGSLSRPPRTGGGLDPADVVAARVDVDAALASLPVEFRTAVVLRDVCDLPYDEIAAIVGVPVGTVRSRIARARSALAATWQTGDSDSAGPAADGFDAAPRPASGVTGNDSGPPDVKTNEVSSPRPSQEEERTS
jgi:RNA polymerase sigma-70 factor (ECF subfamily)